MQEAPTSSQDLAGDDPAEHLEKVEVLGEAIADASCIVVTGACAGLPLAAARGAKRRNGMMIGVSPAERNIGERISELTSQFHQTRQTAITEEPLDILGGFEALGADA